MTYEDYLSYCNELDDSDIVQEGFIQKIGKTAQDLIQSIKNCIYRLIRKVTEFIHKKLYQYLKIPTVNMNRDFYNKSMDMLLKLDEIELNEKDYLCMNISIIVNKPDKVQSLQDKLLKASEEVAKLQKEYLANPFPKTGEMIQVRLGYLKKIESKMFTMQKNAKKQLAVLELCQKELPTVLGMEKPINQSSFSKDSSEEKKKPGLIDRANNHVYNSFNKWLEVGMKFASLNLTKANLMIEITQNMGAYIRSSSAQANECSKYIDFFDNYQIAEEKYRGVYSSGKDSKKNMVDLDLKIKGLPESTKNEISHKLTEVKHAKELCMKLDSELSQLTPDNMDKVISAIAHVTGDTVQILGTVRTIEKKFIKGIHIVSIRSVVSSTLALVGYKKLSRLLKTFTIGSQQKFINSLRKETQLKIGEYNIMEKKLQKKLLIMQ